MKYQKNIWFVHFLKSIVFFISALFVLALFRLAFLYYFSIGSTEVTLNRILPSLWVGLRIDAK